MGELQIDIGKFKTVRVLGEGRYATVYEGISINGKRVAMKILNKYLIKGTNPDFIKNELAVYKKIEKEKVKCENIIHFISHFREKSNVIMILEYINGFTLRRVIFESFNSNKKISSSEKKIYLEQIGNGLKYLHSLNIFHCDLKPENVLIYDENGKIMVKICDFGCSHIIPEGVFDSIGLRFSGTAGFTTPEVYNDKQKLVKLVDIDTWAYTCLLYYCFVGKHSFETGTIYNTIRNVIEINVDYTGVCKNIANICTKVFKSGDRSKIDEIIQDIKNLNICEL